MKKTLLAVCAVCALGGCSFSSHNDYPGIMSQLQIREFQTRAFDTADTLLVMKALLNSPELERSFLDLEITCRRLVRKTLCPPIGLLTVAALLPQDWELCLRGLNVCDLTDADWGGRIRTLPPI